MNRKRLLVLVAVLIAAAALTAFAVTSGASHSARALDPRTASPLVKVADATRVAGSQRGFTGSVGARVQSNLGFRVSGKITARLVDVGQQVKGGQPLMRLDANDLRLAVTSKQNAVLSARAVVVQTRADERRYDKLTNELNAEPPQRYEQAKAVYDASAAQLAAAEAEARMAENEVGYATLFADADGTVVETLAEPGQVVAAGQPVVRLAHAGPREAVVALPETVHPAIGSLAEASVYGAEHKRVTAHLRQLSDAADPQTRTYEARYVLDGDAAATPLGATVTIRIANSESAVDYVEVPIAAVFDSGNSPGVYVIDRATSVVHFRPIVMRGLSDENAVVSGLGVGESVVALGAQLLHDGLTVRTSITTADAR